MKSMNDGRIHGIGHPKTFSKAFIEQLLKYCLDQAFQDIYFSEIHGSMNG